MQDTHNTVTGLNGGGPEGNPPNDWPYFTVFDDHAGANVSAPCAKHVLDCVLQSESFNDDVVKGIHSALLTLNNKMGTLPEVSNGEDISGSTPVCAFISAKQMFIANCGDSRAVLAHDGRPVFATQDHNPGLPTERERIQNTGGSVIVQRINGNLPPHTILLDLVQGMNTGILASIIFMIT